MREEVYPPGVGDTGVQHQGDSSHAVGQEPKRRVGGGGQ